MVKAELHPAFVWDCDKCGRENFVRAISRDMSDDEREELFRLVNDMDEWEELPDGWQEFELLSMPCSVICHHCATEYDAHRDGCECDDGDDEHEE